MIKINTFYNTPTQIVCSEILRRLKKRIKYQRKINQEIMKKEDREALASRETSILIEPISD